MKIYSLFFIFILFFTHLSYSVRVKKEFVDIRATGTGTPETEYEPQIKIIYGNYAKPAKIYPALAQQQPGGSVTDYDYIGPHNKKFYVQLCQDEFTNITQESQNVAQHRGEPTSDVYINAIKKMENQAQSCRIKKEYSIMPRWINPESEAFKLMLSSLNRTDILNKISEFEQAYKKCPVIKFKTIKDVPYDDRYTRGSDNRSQEYRYTQSETNGPIDTKQLNDLIVRIKHLEEESCKKAITLMNNIVSIVEQRRDLTCRKDQQQTQIKTIESILVITKEEAAEEYKKLNSSGFNPSNDRAGHGTHVSKQQLACQKMEVVIKRWFLITDLDDPWKPFAKTSKDKYDERKQSASSSGPNGPVHQTALQKYSIQYCDSTFKQIKARYDKLCAGVTPEPNKDNASGGANENEDLNTDADPQADTADRNFAPITPIGTINLTPSSNSNRSQGQQSQGRNSNYNSSGQVINLGGGSGSHRPSSSRITPTNNQGAGSSFPSGSQASPIKTVSDSLDSILGTSSDAKKKAQDKLGDKKFAGSAGDIGDAASKDKKEGASSDKNTASPKNNLSSLTAQKNSKKKFSWSKWTSSKSSTSSTEYNSSSGNRSGGRSGFRFSRNKRAGGKKSPFFNELKNSVGFGSSRDYASTKKNSYIGKKEDNLFLMLTDRFSHYCETVIEYCY